MHRQIICTIGTSLLSNRDDRPWAGWNPRTPDPLPAADAVDGWLRTARIAAVGLTPGLPLRFRGQAGRAPFVPTVDF